MTGLLRHLTAREVWPSMVAVTAIAVVIAAVCVSLTAQPSLTSWWIPVASLTPALINVLLIRTLAGHDVTLERSLSRSRPALYAWHASGVIAAGTVASAAIGLAVLDSNGTLAMTRNGLGFAGLALISAAVLRTAATWMPIVGYALFILMAAPREPGGTATAWSAWPTQPGDTPAAWGAATALLLIGTVSYVRRGPTP